jgi:signal transduction histidine kinase
MAVTSVLDQLSALPSMASVPRAQLEWLVAHGRVLRFDAGDVMFSKSHPPPGMYVVLSGRFSITVERGGVTSVIRRFEAGGLAGHLPYSRMTAPPGDVVADEPVDMLLIASDDIGEMTARCYDFTALCVHEMVDRARAFKSDDLHREKMASLGRLSAGLAHELNNPSSAIVRSAKEMDACRQEVADAARALGAASLGGAQLEAVGALEAAAASAGPPRSSLEQSDREDAIARWLDDHGVEASLALPLAGTALELAALDRADGSLARDQLAAALRHVAANAAARQLTDEIAHAATRIHTLVAAVKKHTHMDRAPIVEAVHLHGHLTDTLTLVAGKARGKTVTLELQVEPDLPPVRGVVGELNEVWLNLVDNAIDAVRETGRIAVTARRERDAVVVRVIDDGAGIAEGDRARVFEPFFTTKPVGQGAGLGLDVVQGIVRSHGGSVDLQSMPGRTEFRVSLPIFGR